MEFGLFGLLVLIADIYANLQRTDIGRVDHVEGHLDLGDPDPAGSGLHRLAYRGSARRHCPGLSNPRLNTPSRKCSVKGAPSGCAFYDSGSRSGLMPLTDVGVSRNDAIHSGAVAEHFPKGECEVVSEFSQVTSPIAKASGLPNAHYVSEAMFVREREHVLFANWSGVGFAKDLSEAGDAVPIDFLGMPLLAVRDRKGAVRVYQNTCRHRGMILVDRPRKLGGVIRCPYHSWCYSLNGDLVATPHVGGPGMNRHGAIERAELGLVEIRSHVWRDVIFVNVSATAPPFEAYAAEAIERWREFEGQSLFHAGDDSNFSFDVACNWKLAVENYCESYHLPWIHPGLNSYSRLEDHYHIEQPGRFSGQGTLVYRPMITDQGRRFPDFVGLSEKWDAGAEYIALYPNVLFAVHRDHAYAMILEPKTKDRTIERTALYYATEEACGPSWADMRQRNTEMWRSVLEEDLHVVEGMQRGRNGVYFDGGRFSPVMDGPTHLFHVWVAECLSGKDQVAAG